MENSLLQSPILLAALAVLFVFCITLAILLASAKRDIKRVLSRQNTLFQGKNAASLEQIIFRHEEDLKSLDKDVQELFEISNRIHRLAFKGIHKVGVIRFNPFKEVGGNQSFAIALLDGKNSGTVISSLHTREGSRIYAKPILAGESPQFPLTEEERQAVAEAQSPKDSDKKP